MSADSNLTEDLARQLLAFEAQRPNHSGAKETAIIRELGLTPPRYYQLLRRLIATELAVRIDPMLTHRLRRLRDTRAAAHLARIHGAHQTVRTHR